MMLLVVGVHSKWLRELGLRVWLANNCQQNMRRVRPGVAGKGVKAVRIGGSTPN